MRVWRLCISCSGRGEHFGSVGDMLCKTWRPFLIYPRHAISLTLLLDKKEGWGKYSLILSKVLLHKCFAFFSKVLPYCGVDGQFFGYGMASEIPG